MKTDVELNEDFVYSSQYKDIYFSKNYPIKESEYVFSNLIDEIIDKKDYIVVGEAGFGLGINFLTTCKKFKDSKKRLHYISIENSPFTKDDLRIIYKKYGFKKSFYKNLLDNYPALISGYHRVWICKNITLDLYFSDISRLSELDFKADIWFMDGFSPSTNPKMWSDEVFKNIASLSHKGTLLSTYSVAKVVKDGLKQNGFRYKKVKGFGDKNSMIKAIFEPKQDELIQINPWYKRNVNDLKDIKNKTFVVIGAGIAGLSTAFKLKSEGLKVIVVEKCSKVATDGSSNFSGLLAPLITKPKIKLGLMHMNAFLFAREFYLKNLSKNLFLKSGAASLAYDQSLENRYFSNSQNEVYRFMDYIHKGIFIDRSLTLRPKKACKFLSKELDILFDYDLESFEELDGKYLLNFKNSKHLISDNIIFCTGSKSEEFFGKGQNPKMNLDKSVKLSSVRGQTSIYKKFSDVSFAVSSKGYFLPSINAKQLVGATYSRADYEIKPRQIDDIENLSSVEEFLGDKKLKYLSSNVGFRSYSSDRFPIIGQFHDVENFKQNYKSIRWNKDKASLNFANYKNGIYFNFAHGSRGLCTAILGAEIVKDMILNRPLCIEKSLLNELNPARFLIRELKKS